MATRARLTAQDLWHLGAGDVRRELVDGEIVEMTPVGGVHGQVVARLTRALMAHVESQGGGEVMAGDVGCLLSLPYDAERVRASDVAYVTSGRLPEGRLPEGFCRVHRTSPSKSCPRRTIRWTCSRRYETTSRPGRAWSG